MWKNVYETVGCLSVCPIICPPTTSCRSGLAAEQQILIDSGGRPAAWRTAANSSSVTFTAAVES